MRIRLVNRDISWLDFNRRVLDESRDEANPVLERAKFLAISATNLEEFFSIRFQENGWPVRREILRRTERFARLQKQALRQLEADLAGTGIRLVREPAVIEDDTVAETLFRRHVLKEWKNEVPIELRVLSRRDGGNAFALLRDGRCLKVPGHLPPLFVAANGKLRAFFLDFVLLTQARKFGIDVQAVLRITRNGDFSMDFRNRKGRSAVEIIQKRLRRRARGVPIRLQWTGTFPAARKREWARKLRLNPRQIQRAPGTLGLAGLWALTRRRRFPGNVSRDELLHRRLRERVPRISFRELDRHDFLLHHPYDSFTALVSVLRKARKDPQVTRIEQTLYRTGPDSELVRELKLAARKKKEVSVVVELRARFDEARNLAVARVLSEAGVKVYFGFGRYKLHAKILLISRRAENGKLVRYTHLSTGNYNEATARVYADLGLLTADPAIGRDARRFFDGVKRGKVPDGMRELVIAPTHLHRQLLTWVDRETEAARAGKSARIFVKVNALIDRDLISRLYRASRAGVKVDLVVRGACALIPGKPDLSENIRVVSVVDRFLEHSRIYYFESSRALYLSSADWMPRNFFSRLEIAFPVKDRSLFRYVRDIIARAYLNDSVKARVLTASGRWIKREPSAARHPFQSQAFFLSQKFSPRAE